MTVVFMDVFIAGEQGRGREMQVLLIAFRSTWMTLLEKGSGLIGQIAVCLLKMS